MEKNTREKSLVEVNENSIFYKVKRFFKNLFSKSTDISENYAVIESKNNFPENENKRISFMDSIKNTEDEDTKLLKLQMQYRSGEIKEEELTVEQINSLCTLYDRQIENLKKSNKIRKQRLLEYKTKSQAYN